MEKIKLSFIQQTARDIGESVQIRNETKENHRRLILSEFERSRSLCEANSEGRACKLVSSNVQNYAEAYELFFGETVFDAESESLEPIIQDESANVQASQQSNKQSELTPLILLGAALLI